MKIIDLTQKITADMPVYPGTEQPKLTTANTWEKDGFRETLLSFYSHTGTHMDAPYHIFSEGISLDEMDADCFVGKALVIDCTDAGEGGSIGMEYIEKVRPLADKADFLLFHTGWDRYWGKTEYFGAYPVVSMEVCRYVRESGKKGVGFDVIGIDPIADGNLTRHRYLLQDSRRIIVENLTNLGQVGAELFTLAALPLRYHDADGAPVRAVAILEE
ncbi:MAG: cyclase family protein [Bacillota bacterium]|nr:cyclase family protein [Bacillota bacterium]